MKKKKKKHAQINFFMILQSYDKRLLINQRLPVIVYGKTAQLHRSRCQPRFQIPSASTPSPVVAKTGVPLEKFHFPKTWI